MADDAAAWLVPYAPTGVMGDALALFPGKSSVVDLSDADIAFAEVNTMDDLARHPHLRRIEVATPNGPVSYPAPAPIVVGEARRYGAVPGIGDHGDLQTPRTERQT